MLPVALARDEFWLAEKRNWKPLIPFFAVSLSFGLQGVMLNPNVDNDYTFPLHPRRVLDHARLLLLEASSHSVRRVRPDPPAFPGARPPLWFGAALLCLFFIPLMFLPGRLFSAYCYLPLAGVALMAAAIADLPRLRPAMAVPCVLWIPWNISGASQEPQATLWRLDNEVRAYVSALADFARGRPPRARSSMTGCRRDSIPGVRKGFSFTCSAIPTPPCTPSTIRKPRRR